MGIIILLFEERKEININEESLSELEKNQLSKVYSYLETFNNLGNIIIVDKKTKVKKFFEFFSNRITAK
jgi:hypothetical protein